MKLDFLRALNTKICSTMDSMPDLELNNWTVITTRYDDYGHDDSKSA